MKRLKGIRFRLYPSDAQRQTLAEWERSLRSLWNLAHEQRLRAMERPKDERRYYTSFDQYRQLKELRAAYPWFAAVPRHVSEAVLDDLDKAWQRCFKGLGYQPRWKKRGDSVGFTETDASAFSVDGTRLHFPKLGAMRIVLHTPIVGKPKRCTIRREAGGEWYASILLETEVDEPAAREEPMVAIDRGVVLLLADSDGRIVENPKHLEQTAKVLARAQRIVARRKKGSKNREKAKLRVAKLHAKVARQREYALHQVSSEYARDYGTVVLEKLKVANMTRSAKGTVEVPGKHVRAKAGLNRSILGAAWGKFGEMLRYKMAWAGGRVVEVHAAYSSQTCSACGHVDAASRVTQAEFRCTSCGHEANADLNAAMVLKARGLRAVEAPAAAVKDVVRLRKPRVLTRKAA